MSHSFKLLDESQVVLRAPRQNGVYSLDLKNIVPSGVRINPDKTSMSLRMDGSCAGSLFHIWSTAIVRTLANGIQELVASVDNKEYTITEASIRSVAEDQEPPHSSPPRLIDRQNTEVPQPQGPIITFVADGWQLYN
ncbi:hypothetical protein Tco_0960190 [Tanacetum coccineum]